MRPDAGLKRFLVPAFLVLTLARVAAAQEVVFVVRHAERADGGMQNSMGPDPPLSAAGEARARTLASMLGSAHVERIFASQFRRTQQTARPLAAAAHVDPIIVPAKDIIALVRGLASGKGAALVVGHSDTVPGILQALGVKEKVTIADDEYDNLFIVVRSGEASQLIALKF